MHAAASTSRSGRRLTAHEASLALMFDQVPVAVDRLALCLETQRRIGASHALLHLRRLAATCLRFTVADDSAVGTQGRHAAMSLAEPLQKLDAALAADRLDRDAISAATQQLAFIHSQLSGLELLVAGDTVVSPPVGAATDREGRDSASLEWVSH